MLLKRYFSKSPIARSLSDFFDNGSGWIWNDRALPTGRAWTKDELRGKSFDDLHTLWWQCLKENNKLESQKVEAKRFKLFFPHQTRVRQVRDTMSRIKFVVWERRTAYLRAKALESGMDVEQVQRVGKSERKLKEMDSKKPVEKKKNSMWTVL
ncbi:mitochondrial 39-S ribosomal protein L47 (MRP-L47)-domain-containing protein [Gorgonomyces haynaldii]|nr:mitochondrial 39-S ribosomal protein L47 (MRP-L47)-domain-containing protein [Gorgonomyces haynaldii]